MLEETSVWSVLIKIGGREEVDKMDNGDSGFDPEIVGSVRSGKESVDHSGNMVIFSFN